MSSESKLPDDVIAELEAKRKVTAIKLLRSQRSIGLKESRKLVDEYLERNPANSSYQMPKSDTGIGRILVLIIGVSAIFAIYKYLY